MVHDNYVRLTGLLSSELVLFWTIEDASLDVLKYALELSRANNDLHFLNMIMSTTHHTDELKEHLATIQAPSKKYATLLSTYGAQ